jgi:hypothetical protein
MPTPAHRTYTFIERVICNPIGLLFIIGVIVVVVNILIGDPPDTPKPLKSIDSDNAVNEDIVKD